MSDDSFPRGSWDDYLGATGDLLEGHLGSTEEDDLDRAVLYFYVGGDTEVIDSVFEGTAHPTCESIEGHGLLSPTIFGFGLEAYYLVDVHNVPALEASPGAFEYSLLFRSIGRVLSTIGAFGVGGIGAALAGMHGDQTLYSIVVGRAASRRV